MTTIQTVLGDRYQLQQKLGHDASRQTWLALDTQAHPPEQVVVKLLAVNPQMQWDESKLFEREAQVLKTLNHPRIPRYRDYFTLESLSGSRFPWFGLVQSYIPGASLQQLLDQGHRFSETQIEAIAIGVLQILAYLHDLSPPLLHRDIKPSNIIWGEDEQVYLVDFGAVQDQAALEGATFTVVGTYGYVPMEQFGGRAVPASDLYALGATLIHLVTGQSPADLPQRGGRLQLAEQTNLDSGWINWLSKLTAPDLYDRVATASEALETLRQRSILMAPTIRPQPRGSKIHIRKSAHTLDIEIPRQGIKAYYSLRRGGALLSIVSLVPFFFVSPWFSLIGLLLLGVLISTLPAGFERTSLHFDRESFWVTYQLFGFRYSQKGRYTSMVEVSSGTDVEEDERFLDLSVAKRDKVSDRLIFRAGSKLYKTNLLSKTERIWLKHEIEDWLQSVRKSYTDQ